MRPAAMRKTLAPIIRTTIHIFILTLLVSCSGRRALPRHTDIFTYSDEKTGDIVKYYGFKNLDTAIFHATRENKNILVIFSGYACMAIGGQEWRTLSLLADPDKIYHQFVIAWLAVDDSRPSLDTSQTVFWHGKQRRLTTIGDKNKYLEELLFNTATQPLFGFMDTSQNIFGQTLGYTKNQSDVDSFINSGLER